MVSMGATASNRSQQLERIKPCDSPHLRACLLLRSVALTIGGVPQKGTTVGPLRNVAKLTSGYLAVSSGTITDEMIKQ